MRWEAGGIVEEKGAGTQGCGIKAVGEEKLVSGSSLSPVNENNH